MFEILFYYWSVTALHLYMYTKYGKLINCTYTAWHYAVTYPRTWQYFNLYKIYNLLRKHKYGGIWNMMLFQLKCMALFCGWDAELLYGPDESYILSSRSYLTSLYNQLLVTHG